MALRIITDSATDLPKSIIEEYNLHVIPTPVVIEGKDYFDGKTIKPEEFYKILSEGKEISTYHINTFMFKENFEPYAKTKDEVIYICFSTGLAGTFNAARLAKEELLETYEDFDLTIIDSKSASLGFGLIVYMALMMQKNGADKATIIEAINYHIEHMEHVFTVDTLEYLFKGGRLSKTSKVVGELLNIRPIIEVIEDGSLSAFEKVRGRNKSLSRCVDIIEERCKNPKEQIFGICHGDDYESLKKVEKMIADKYGADKFVESYVGCAIGAHTGPGIIGIVYLDGESPYANFFN